MLTPEKYQKLQALLADNEKELSDEFRQQAQSAVDGYKNDFLARGKFAGEKPPAEGESDRILSVGQAVKPELPHPDEAKVQQLVSSLDPGLSLPAQALAVSPSTTHPMGDEAAKEEWVRGDLQNPNGVVIAFEMPVDKVREKLLAEPELYRALQMSVPADPESVMSIQEGDSTHQAYNDYYWRQAAEAAAKAGKTIYRKSKAPWLGDGANASRLNTLSTKLKASAYEGIDTGAAFLLGMDDTASLGAGRAAAEAGGGGLLDMGRAPAPLTPEEEASGKWASHPTLGKVPKEWVKKGAVGTPVGGGNDEIVGGVLQTGSSGQSEQELSDRLEENHPTAHSLGQALGALAPWTVANNLWGWAVGEGAEAGASTALRGAASGIARGAAAGAVEQGVREGVQAGSSYAATGDSGTTLGEAAGRIGTAAGPGAIMHGLGGGIRGLGRQIGEEVRWGDRYKGAPGRVEAQGVEPKLIKGHEAPPVVKEAEKRGRVEGGRSPLAVLAGDLNEPLGEAARFRRAEVERVGEGNRAEHYATGEGKATLPVRNLVETAAVKLRKLTSEVGEGLKGVGKARSENPVKDIFNANIEGVSSRKTKTGIPLSVKEARSFLSPEWQAKLDLEKLAEKKNATVYVTPRRYDSQHADEVIEQLRSSKHADAEDLYEAALEDRGERSWSGEKGGWSKVQEEQSREHGEASDTAKRIGADRRRGPQRAVTKLGKSRGQGEDLPALEEAAKRAGGDAPEKLRGARVAEDLTDLKSWTSAGGRSPGGDGKRSLMGLTALGDMAVLRGVYPATRKLEKLKPGAAGTAGRVAEAVARNATDDRADDRRKGRDEKHAEGYQGRAKEAEDKAPKAGKRKFKPWKRSTSEAHR